MGVTSIAVGSPPPPNNPELTRSPTALNFGGFVRIKEIRILHV